MLTELIDRYLEYLLAALEAFGIRPAEQISDKEG